MSARPAGCRGGAEPDGTASIIQSKGLGPTSESGRWCEAQVGMGETRPQPHPGLAREIETTEGQERPSGTLPPERRLDHATGALALPLLSGRCRRSFWHCRCHGFRIIGLFQAQVLKVQPRGDDAEVKAGLAIRALVCAHGEGGI